MLRTTRLMNLGLILCIVAAPFWAAAQSRLDKIESSEPSPPSQVPSGKKFSSYDDDSDASSSVFSEILFGMFFLMGESSWKAMYPLEAVQEEPFFSRKKGDLILPIAKLETTAFRLDSDLEGYEVGGHLGFGFVGLNGGYLRLQENNPDDDLSIAHWQFVFRFTLTDHFEWSPGIGGAKFKGNQDRSGVSLTSPVNIYVKDYYSLRFRPIIHTFDDNVWLSDVSLGLGVDIQGVSIMGGYRWFSGEDFDESGPTAGLAIHW